MHSDCVSHILLSVVLSTESADESHWSEVGVGVAGGGKKMRGFLVVEHFQQYSRGNSIVGPGPGDRGGGRGWGGGCLGTRDLTSRCAQPGDHRPPRPLMFLFLQSPAVMVSYS